MSENLIQNISTDARVALLPYFQYLRQFKCKHNPVLSLCFINDTHFFDFFISMAIYMYLTGPASLKSKQYKGLNIRILNFIMCKLVYG